VATVVERYALEQRPTHTPEEHPGAPLARLMALDQVIRWLCPRPPTQEELTALRALGDREGRRHPPVHQETSEAASMDIAKR
jgi:hypothetical protein